VSPVWLRRRGLICVLLGLLLTWRWLQAGEMRNPSGMLALTLHATVAPGGGMRRTTGEGRLTLSDGSAHTFSMSGLDPARPTNTVIIENDQEVLIVVTVTAAIEQTDVRILPSETGVTVKLRE